MADEPQEQIWETSYGLVLSLKIPRPIFEITVKLGVHHLEDLVTAPRTAALTEASVVSGARVSPTVARVYSQWVVMHSALLGVPRTTDEPLWTLGPDSWEPAVSNTPSISVIGGRGAKREKVRMVPVAASLLEIDEDLLLSLGRHTRNLPLIGSPELGEPPILDVRFHKTLTYLLKIHTHYGAPLWVHVDQDIDRADLEDWDEVNDLPQCRLALRGRSGPRLLEAGFIQAQDHSNTQPRRRPLGAVDCSQNPGRQTVQIPVPMQAPQMPRAPS